MLSIIAIRRFLSELILSVRTSSLAELLLKEDGSVQMIRRAETPKDYFATFDFCDKLDKLNLN